MPWKEATSMSLRWEFVQAALQADANLTELCRRFDISRKTGYKWLARYEAAGSDPRSLVDRSRRPQHSPWRTPEAMEEAILEVRDAHPPWGGRKIRAYLLNSGHVEVPSASTITSILRRHGRLDAEKSDKHRAFQRFEMDHPNKLWQMDFKGYFPLAKGGYCHPLTILDDHSRFLLELKACPDETRDTVQTSLIAVFRRYGLPERLLLDNGPPWGSGSHGRYTRLGAWLMRMGIRVIHSRPYHPQTLGKDERLHRTLQAEVIDQSSLETLDECQVTFDWWRPVYNEQRPHEALGMLPPASHYHPSARVYPEMLPPVLYDMHDTVRKVDASGKIYFRNLSFRIGKGFSGQPVAVRPSDLDGEFEIWYCQQRIAKISLLHDNHADHEL